jgi:hypothetical protein
MSRARRIGIAAVIIAMSLCAPVRPASACSCVFRDLAEQVQAASTVFVGTVTSAGETSATFDVDRVYKGTVPGETPISNTFSGTDCAIPFTEGRTYVVFAALQNGTLSTGLCSGTTDDLSVADRLSVNAGPTRSPQAGPPVVRVIVVSRRTVPIAAAAAIAALVAAALLLSVRRALDRPRPFA